MNSERVCIHSKTNPSQPFISFSSLTNLHIHKLQMASPSSRDSHLYKVYNVNKNYHEDEDKDQTKKKASKTESDWLELGLGLSTSTCRKEEEKEEEEEEGGLAKLVTVSATHGSHYLDKQVGLDLRLEIGREGEADKNRKERHNHNPKMGVVALHQCYWNEGNDHLQQLGKEEKETWPFYMKYSVRDELHDCNKMPLPNDQTHYLSTPTSGLWFVLRPTVNRKGEAALPQIPKAYIRVKDENMTVFTVKKYLVTKLGLSSEAEMEISCMGQKLLQTQSLKQVRDGVWLPRLLQFLDSNLTSFLNPLSQSPSTTYIMSLHYGTPPLL